MLKYIVVVLAVLSLSEALFTIKIPSFKKPKHFVFESTYPVHVVNRYPVPVHVPVPYHFNPIIQTVREPVYIDKPVYIEKPVVVEKPVVYNAPVAPVVDCVDDFGGY